MQTETGALELTAEHAVAGGRCLARHEGKVILVAGALPGERVRVRLTRDDKRFGEGEVTEVLEASPSRRTPPCPHADRCGGCDFQHAERDAQLAMKREIVADAFRRIAKVDVEGEGILEGPAATGPEFGWRNRIRLSFDSAGRPGLLGRGSHEVVALDTCLLPDDPFRDTFLPWMRMLPPWKKATLRFDSEGRSVLLLETGEPPSPKDRKRLGALTKGMEPPPGMIGLIADGIPLAGQRDLHFRVRDTDLRADATSFFQVNPHVTGELVRVVEECLGEERGALLDLYAGVGLFSACLGRGFERVVATEADPRAARHLKRNLRKAGVRGEARAEQALVTLRMLPKEGEETVLLDPPRTGLTPEARQALVERAPRRIVSVSCDPATGARDAGALVRAGWTLRRVTALDLFPVTAHVETVSLLVREDAPEPATGAPAAHAGKEGAE